MNKSKLNFHRIPYLKERKKTALFDISYQYVFGSNNSTEMTICWKTIFLSDYVSFPIFVLPYSKIYVSARSV